MYYSLSSYFKLFCESNKYTLTLEMSHPANKMYTWADVVDRVYNIYVFVCNYIGLVANKLGLSDCTF